MKKLLLLFAACCAALTATAQTYVDAGASGTNDGSSWANAYADLSVAIDSAATGDTLWIAAGRYVTPADGPFFIDRGITLIGGFAGDETDASQADPAANATILSGDVMGNDPDNFDAALMADNNQVIVAIDTNETSQFTIGLHGLTIRDGVIAEDFPSGGDLTLFAGGGIYSEARLDVSDCIFTANRAPFGGAVTLLFVTTSNSSFVDCDFSNNYTDLAGLAYVRITQNILFDGCTFNQDNETEALTGAIQALGMFNLIVNNTTFENFNAPGEVGAGILTIDVLGQLITNSSFENITSNAGGPLFFSNDSLFQSDRDVTATECVIDSTYFGNNRSLQFGAVAYMDNISHAFLSSQFEDNIGSISRGLGGTVYGRAGDTLNYQYVISDCDITGNEASGGEDQFGVGAGLFYFGDRADIRIFDSKFENNVATASGGGLYIAGDTREEVVSVIARTEFSGNEAQGFSGSGVRVDNQNLFMVDCNFEDHRGQNGSLYVQGGGSAFQVRRTIFEDNGDPANPSFARGAAICTFTDADNPFDLFIDSCVFINNVVSDDDFISGGGAIYLGGEPGDPSRVGILNSLFQNNSGLNDASGGAIQIVNGVDLRIANSDFFANTSDQGGAINTTRTVLRDTVNGVPMINYDSDDEPLLDIERSFFLNNTASGQGGAIILNASDITAKNSIFVNNTVSLGGGSGGAILLNGSSFGPATMEATLVNNTFYNNGDGARLGDAMTPPSAGNDVGIFQPGNTVAAENSVTLTIQNNAFFPAAPDEESIGLELNIGDANDMVGFGEINVNSLGGNYFASSLDATLAFSVTAQDILNVDAQATDFFVDPEEDMSDIPDLTPIDEASNPLIDGGTEGDLVTRFDFLGLERVDQPDIGAIEVDGVVDVAEPVEESGLKINFFPNPTPDVLTITNEEAGVNEFMVYLSDAQGRILTSGLLRGEVNTLNLVQLPAGVYGLQLRIGDKVYSKQVVKQ